MTFLNPAILWGLLAVSIPIIIHIFNLKKTRKIEFSTLMFIKEIQQNQYKKIRLKQLLILLCRIAMIILLILGFSRPLQRGYLGSVGSKARSSVLLILDNSFSMQTRTQSGNYFDEAKSKLSETIDLLDETDEVYFTTTSDINKPGGAKLFKNLIELKDSVSHAQISDVTKKLSEVMFYANKIIGNSSNAYKEVFLFTDGQKSFIEGDINSQTEIIKGEKIKYNIFLVGSRKANNISLDSIDIVTKIFEKNRNVRLKCTIKNHNLFNAVNKSIILSLPGTGYKDEKVIDIPANSLVDIEYNFTPNSAGFSNGFVEILQNEITDDEIANDNRRYFTFKVPDKIKLLFVSSSPDDIEFIKLALASSEDLMRDSANNPVNYFDITLIGENELGSRFSARELNNFNCIVLTNKKSFTETETDMLYEYVQDGGGIIVYPGLNSLIANYNETLIRRFDLQPVGPEFGNSEGNESYIFDEVDIQHPVFEGIFKHISSEPNYFIKESPKVKYGTALHTGRNSLSLIKLNNGVSFLVEYTSGKGKILFYSNSPDLKNSDFPLKDLFSPITVRAIMYLANNNPVKEATTGRDYFIGAVELLQPSPADTITLARSTVSSGFELGKIELSAGMVNFKPYLDHSSIYKLFSGQSELYEFPCNFDNKESETEKSAVDEIEKTAEEIYGISANVIGPDSRITSSILELRTGKEVWQYFLLIALIFLAIEFYLSKSLMKK